MSIYMEDSKALCAFFVAQAWSSVVEHWLETHKALGWVSRAKNDHIIFKHSKMLII